MERYFTLDYKCPLCGGKAITENDPGRDPSMTEWCTSDGCDWFTSQFLDYINEEGEEVPPPSSQCYECDDYDLDIDGFVPQCC